MKKNIYLLVMFILGMQLMQAKPVTPNTAQNVVISFCKQHTTTIPLVLTLAHTEMSLTAEAVYYIFNINANDGFIIVSADDAAHPIIGYVTTGKYVVPATGSNIDYWLTKKKNEIINIRNKNIAAVDIITREWAGTNNTNTNRSSSHNSVMDISPLVSTAWDQSPYFNALCPGGSVTGCVATAMAQIMKRWSYPTQGTGSSSYTQTPNPNNYPAQSANYGATTYNWANMPNSISSANSDIATLMYQCGVSVDMNYDPGGSSSYMLGSYTTPCAQTSYVKYFTYDSLTIRGLNRSSYTDSAWTAILVNDLTIGRPIQYAGQDATQGGHSWVCDGYQQSNGFFHMNWGWGGLYTGYYSLDALNPSTYDFINTEQALIGIQPVLALPPVSDFMSATTTGCGSGSITFEDQSSNAATSWSWTFNGGNPATSALQNPVVTYSTPGTYSVTLQASNSYGTGTTVTKTGYITIYNTGMPTACTPSTGNLSNNYGIGTFNVTLNTINNTSAGAVIDGGYKNFSCQNHTTLQTSTVYTLNVTVGSGNNENIKVYIDYNNNGSFVDAGELIYQASSVKGLQVGTFTTPASPITGTYLRMRVLDDFYSNSIVDACTSLLYGQAEDYGVYFAASLSPATSFTSNITSVCVGGSVNFTDQSTNSPTSWSWTFESGTPSTSASQNPAISYTAVGTYSVSLVATNAAGNNTKTINGYITVNANPTALATTSNVSCYGGTNGTATLTPSGGATPYTYSWSPNGGTTGLSAGNYTYTIADNNGCKNTYTLNITQPAAITSSQSHTLCMGQSVLVGSSTYTANGTYTNTLTASHGCDSIVTTHLLVNTLPSVMASVTSSTVCSGVIDTLKASGAVTYTWSANAGNATTGTTSVSPTGNATYTVMGTDANSCENSSAVSVTVTSCATTGIEQSLNNNVGINIWPNPALNNIEVSVSNNQLTNVKVFDVLGKEVMNQTSTASNQKSMTIDVSALPNSVYFVQVKTSQGAAIQKIIVQH